MVDALIPLFTKHYAEVEAPRDPVPFAPNIEDYVSRQRRGNLVAFGLFFGEELIGYCMYQFGNSKLHSLPVAIEDITFVDPVHRRGFLGIHFLRATLAALKELGVHQVSMGCTLQNNISPIYKRLGFQHTAEFYTKVL
jgi:GNAT superfamily N-acetyltransferase